MLVHDRYIIVTGIEKIGLVLETNFYGFIVHYIFKSTCVSYCENELGIHVLTLFLG